MTECVANIRSAQTLAPGMCEIDCATTVKISVQMVSSMQPSFVMRPVVRIRNASQAEMEEAALLVSTRKWKKNQRIESVLPKIEAHVSKQSDRFWMFISGGGILRLHKMEVPLSSQSPITDASRNQSLISFTAAWPSSE
mgnify:CR=1 FL=1